MGDTTNVKLLLPDRHPQHELFYCDVADAALKDMMPQLEHPFYSLSKKPETTVRRYEHNGNYLEIIPSVKGMATIYDKDILIYCISQIMHAIKNGEKVSKRVRINSHELLIFTNRGTSGRDYMALQDSLERIRGMTISTNIKTGDEEQIDTFGLIESSSVRRKHGLDGRLLWCEVTLSDWVFNAIEANEVLTLHPDYFRLRKPMERRVYEIARKHCGRQEIWRARFETLHKKTGSKATSFEFRRMIRDLAKGNHLPDYYVTIEGENVVFRNRGTMHGNKQIQDTGETIHVSPDAIEKGRAAAPGYDIYVLESAFKEFWYDSGQPELKSVDGAFIGFCKKRYQRNPNP